ncbi:MAG: uroporphyrinogen-III synthase [Acinetobacter sp.]
MLFLNTRPADRAIPLTEFLQAQDIEVLDLPLLELAPMPWSNHLAHLYAALPSAQVVVAVSPSAVQYGMQGLAQAGLSLEHLSHLTWIAVGEATAKALLQYGIHSQVPEVETSEGMLNLPVLQQLPKSSSVAFWRGEGGRQFMMDSLQAKGVKLLNFILYQRQCPEQAPKIIEKNISRLQLQQRYCMLVSSEASWLNWRKLMAEHIDLLNRAHFLVLGERLYQLLAQDRLRHHFTFSISQLHDLRKESILEHIALVQGNS